MNNSMVQVWGVSECPEEHKRHLDDCDLVALVKADLVSELTVNELATALNTLVRAVAGGCCDQMLRLKPNGDLLVTWHHS